MRIRLTTTLAILYCAIGYLPAQAFESAFSSRLLAPDPEWQATRGARAATGSNFSSGLGNPAGAASVETAGAAFSHLAWAGDLSREWAAVGGPLGERFHVVVDAGLLHGPELEGFNASGQSVGAFSPSEWNLGTAVSAEVLSGLELGAGARFHRLEDPIDPLSGVGFSVGARMRWESRTFGAALTDMGSASSEGGQNYQMPTRWRAGFEQSFLAGSSAALSVDGGESAPVTARFGMGYRPRSWMSLLGGVSASNEEDSTGGSVHWSTGVVLENRGIEVSYAYHPSETLGTTHHFAIALPFHRPHKMWRED